MKKLNVKVELMDEDALHRALMRLSYEIIEKKPNMNKLVLVGIETRGVPLANEIQANILKISNVSVPLERLNIQYYRDDLEKISDIPQVEKPHFASDINDAEVVLVDDVLYTGRTARAAIDALFDIGRPAKVSLAILVDRGHRELPIRPDFIGKNVPTSNEEVISVNLKDIDGKTNVEICEVLE